MPYLFVLISRSSSFLEHKTSCGILEEILEGNVYNYLKGADTDVGYYMYMDWAASMKTPSYEVLCKLCVQDGKITSVIASTECPAGQYTLFS